MAACTGKLRSWRLAKSDLEQEFPNSSSLGDVITREILMDSERLNMWSIYEKTYYSQKYGLIGPAEWGRFERVICKYTKSTPDFWKENVAKFLTEGFRDFVISTCNLTE
jgi:hypothetical protein